MDAACWVSWAEGILEPGSVLETGLFTILATFDTC